MATKLYSATIRGIEGLIVSVEVNISRGLPSFHIVGLANASVREARERVRAAIENSGFKFPLGRIVINLAPGDEKKVGSHLDLSIALGILIESNQISIDNVEEYIIIGELFLNGDINRVKGILSIIMSGIKSGYSKFIIPEKNKEEASYYKSGEIYSINTLRECINYLKNKDLLPIEKKEILNCNYKVSMEDVIGQEAVKRALIISAIGKHNILLFGPPGAGKTMLAERLLSLLERPSMSESLEIAQIYNTFCSTKETLNVISKRPFRNPHHSINISGLITGKGDIPGEITLAHNGVLFLDEISEFKREAIESLREPLEKKKIHINKNKIVKEYPCDFLLIAAMNMCKCGNYGGPNNYKCTCGESERKKYLYKISRPVLDRIDLFSYVERVESKNNFVNTKEQVNIKELLDKARLIQSERYEKTNYKYNSEVEGKDILKLFKPTKEAISYLERIYDKYGISLRGKNKIIRISRSIADYEGEEKIEWQHIVEALSYRKYADGEVV